MEAYIKKYFWLVSVTVVACCAYFGAIAVNHIIESKALADSKTIAKAPKVIPTSSTRKKAATLSKKGDVIAVRNMFCSSCVLVEEDDSESDGAVVDSDRPPTTSLPLRLVATNVSTEPGYSFATIQNTSTDRQGSYSIDQEIPDGGSVVRISAKYVDFTNTSKKRVERLSLLSTKAPIRKAKKTPAKKSKPASAKDEMLAMIDDGVNKISDTEFELDRKVVDKILENPASVMRGARIVPSIKNGKANGFKLYAIRPSSVYAKIGLMNGDTIHAINGMELNSLDKGLEIYAKLRSATNLSVNATRRGKPVTLSYSIK